MQANNSEVLEQIKMFAAIKLEVEEMLNQERNLNAVQRSVLDALDVLKRHKEEKIRLFEAAQPRQVLHELITHRRALSASLEEFMTGANQTIFEFQKIHSERIARTEREMELLMGAALNEPEVERIVMQQADCARLAQQGFMFGEARVVERKLEKMPEAPVVPDMDVYSLMAMAQVLSDPVSQ